MLEKATILNVETGDRVEVMFNPEEYSLRRDVNYAQTSIPGLSAPVLQFVAGNMQTLEMELFIDTYEDRGFGSDAREVADQVISLMDILPETHAPPRLDFVWGTLTFTCVLATASSTYQMFSPDGIPVRIRLQVTFHEYRDLEAEARALKRETADHTTEYRVRQGDSVWSIAGRMYNDPLKWRAIALANHLADPADIEVGDALRIPALPFRDPTSERVFS
jgi:hypothetical protein